MKLWILGARPRTLPAALVPVAVGTAAAAPDVVWWRAAVAWWWRWHFRWASLRQRLFGRDQGNRRQPGRPARLVGGGLAAPGTVRWAAFGAFTVAAVAGLVLAIAAGPWLIAVGLGCIAAAWYYTGGRRPYGYAGFGEVFVFVFFGLVATAGTAFVQTEELTWLAVAAAVPVGLLASALLMANNLRDIDQDQAAGKRTLAVRLGERRSAHMYAALVLAAVGVGASLAVARPWAPLTLASLSVAMPAIGLALCQESKSRLLNRTALLHLVYGALLTVGLAISA